MATALKVGLTVPAQYLVDPTSDLLVDAMTGATVGYPVYYGGVIHGWLDASGAVIAGEASPAGGVAVGGFGGYDPGSPPPGYDAVCWRANNWDYQHGLVCRAVGTQTVLETDLRRWTPWTWDLGQNPPPPQCAYSWAVAQGLSLPHPGPLTLQQAQTLLAAVNADPTMTTSDWLALVKRTTGGGIGAVTPTIAVGTAPPVISGPIQPGPATPSGGVLTTAPMVALPTLPTTATPQVPQVAATGGSGPSSGATLTPPFIPLNPNLSQADCIASGGIFIPSPIGPNFGMCASVPGITRPENPALTVRPVTTGKEIPAWAWLALGAGAVIILLATSSGGE